MTDQKLTFNISTSGFPSENQTFYFAEDDIGSTFYSTTHAARTEARPEDGFPFPIKLNTNCADNEQLKVSKVFRQLIDQVYQFSRMYWKSVRQQNLPVTIKYPEMVAQIAPHFEGNDIPEFGKDNLWFL